MSDPLTPDTPTILTPEEIEELSPWTISALCVSHEALRSRLQQVEQERDEWEQRHIDNEKAINRAYGSAALQLSEVPNVISALVADRQRIGQERDTIRQERDALRERLERREERLEITRQWSVLCVPGEPTSAPVERLIPFDERDRVYDGIDCRDETIKLARQNCDELKSALTAAQRRVTELEAENETLRKFRVRVLGPSEIREGRR